MAKKLQKYKPNANPLLKPELIITTAKGTITSACFSSNSRYVMSSIWDILSLIYQTEARFMIYK